jgi:hypothetical protein
MKSSRGRGNMTRERRIAERDRKRSEIKRVAEI